MTPSQGDIYQRVAEEISEACRVQNVHGPFISPLNPEQMERVAAILRERFGKLAEEAKLVMDGLDRYCNGYEGGGCPHDCIGQAECEALRAELADLKSRFRIPANREWPMGDTKIEWTDKTWTPIRARVKQDAYSIAKQKQWTSLLPILLPMRGHVGPHCERVSPGCENCYSENNNSRCLPHNGTGLPFDRRSRDLVDIFLDEKILKQPLHWKKPQNIFVCSQTDLFGEWVPDEFIDRVFAVMAHCSVTWNRCRDKACDHSVCIRENFEVHEPHIFQVLTKRADRMMEYLSATNRSDKIREAWDSLGWYFEVPPIEDSVWPLPNVWLGVSVESPKHKDRIDILRRVPAAVRMISFEPLLEDVGEVNLDGIGWVIVGGESGPHARPMHPDWARSLRDRCKAANVPFFFKQWGGWSPTGQLSAIRAWSCTCGATGPLTTESIEAHRVGANGCKYGASSALYRVGKKTAGRLLDGVEHGEYPEVRR